MRFKFYYTIIALFISTLSFSQIEGVSLRGGLNIANLSDSKSILSGHVGPRYNMMVDDKVAVQPEFLISGQGAKYKLNFGLFGSVSERIDVIYANVPVMVKYYITDLIDVHAGPQLGFALLSLDSDVDWDFFELGFGVGGEIDLEDGYSVGARYTLGLTDAIANSKNRVFSVYIGFNFM